MPQTAQLTIAWNSPGQDRVYVHHSGSNAIISVADGAGGRSGGAEAAEMVTRIVREESHLLKSPADCENLLARIDKAVADDLVAGETTGIVVVVGPSGIIGASVGDSGAWVVNQSSVDDLTTMQIRKPFLGSGVCTPVGFFRPGFAGTLIVATDGLFKYTSQEKIVTTVIEEKLSLIPEHLVSLVRLTSGALQDDVGIALCRANR